MYGYAMQTNWEWELGQDKGKTTILNSYRWRHYMKHLKFQVLPSPLTRTSQHQVNVEGQWECDDQSNHFKFNQKQRATSEVYWGRCCEDIYDSKTASKCKRSLALWWTINYWWSVIRMTLAAWWNISPSARYSIGRTHHPYLCYHWSVLSLIFHRIGPTKLCSHF